MENPKNSPKEWENYFKDIIRLHYKPSNFKDVPDKHVGDFGIECFSLCGHAFQCYLPEQTTDIAKLVDAQKAKIRSDIKKFTIDNKAKLEKLFGKTPISKWILATPTSDSAELIQYCTQKSIKVRNMKLPYITSDFEILVHTERDYPIEVNLLRRNNYQLTLELDLTSVKKVASVIENKPSFLKKLDLKIPKIMDDEVKSKELRSYIIQKYLEYENLMDYLRQEWTEIFEIIYRNVQNREGNLVGRYLTMSSPLPHTIIQEEIEQLKKDISSEVPTLRGADLEKITWGVVSDWLIRCPLDF